MRLDKHLCKSSLLTRSQAKKMIRQGRVKVNDQVIRKSDCAVKDEDKVSVDNELMTVRGFRYIMLNKPKDFISSTIDEQLPSVLNLIDVAKKEDLFIAGRLDADTTGLLLLTDDGAWSHQITSPRRQCGKTYLVTLDKPITDDIVLAFKEGVQLKSELKPCLPAEIILLSDTQVKLTLSEGKYHQVKRMFASVGYYVAQLHREQIGSIKIDADLPIGKWRHLTDTERSLT